MSPSDIVLIVVSGLGVIHGLFLALFLWIYKKGHSLANKLLSLLLIVLSFRVGKSVFLAFIEDLDVKLIFIGLGTIMAIGPLFYQLTLTCIKKPSQFSKGQLIHYVPALLGICFGFWIEPNHLEVLPIWIFALLFLTYYLHFVVYLVISYRLVTMNKAVVSKEIQTFLKLLFYALLAIWVAYVLNLFDETVPYIVGPVLYSIVAYVVSFEVIRKGYMEKIDQSKYKTTSASDKQIDQTFDNALQLIETDGHYRNPDLSLKSLSETLHVSSHLLSMAINQKSGKNFNSLVNAYRIKEATSLLKDERNHNLTIASIAFDVGFHSISSFNTAFKKQTGKTPQAYRRQVTK